MEHLVSRGIAQVVGARLTAAGISHRDASARTGIPLTTLSRRLAGGDSFRITELDSLATLLDTNISDLVAEVEANVAEVAS